MSSLVLNKVQNIMQEQDQMFVSRTEIIKLIWLSFVSGEHLFLLGPPGVAKSLILEDSMKRIKGAEKFLYLMTKTTMPAEIFGPISLTNLKQDRLQYNINGFVPTADLVFLDEMFKASSTILNSLLRIINEREFVNGSSGIVKAPLKSLVTASNELPEGPELQALYDRILIRSMVRDLDADSDFRTALSGLAAPTDLHITVEEFKQIRTEAKNVVIPDDVLDLITDIRAQLKIQAGMHASTRRWLRGLNVVRANAVLRGDSTACDEDLLVYNHILWEQPEQIIPVRKALMSTVAPLANKVLDTIDTVLEIQEEMERIIGGRGIVPPEEATSVVVEYQGKLSAARKDLQGFARSSTGLAKSEANRGLSLVNKSLKFLSVKFLNINPASIA